MGRGPRPVNFFGTTSSFHLGQIGLLSLHLTYGRPNIRLEGVLVEDSDNLALLYPVAFFKSHFPDAACNTESQIDLADIHIPIDHQLIALRIIPTPVEAPYCRHQQERPH